MPPFAFEVGAGGVAHRHHVSTDYSRSEVDRWAVCTCGWRGPDRSFMDPHLTGLLDDDMATHCHEVGVRCASSGCVACYPDEAVA